MKTTESQKNLTKTLEKYTGINVIKADIFHTTVNQVKYTRSDVNKKRILLMINNTNQVIFAPTDYVHSGANVNFVSYIPAAIEEIIILYI